MISLNNKGETVVSTTSTPLYYSFVESFQSIVCCGEYQDVLYCFKSNTKQGCSYCDFDPYSECECVSCQE